MSKIQNSLFHIICKKNKRFELSFEFSRYLFYKLTSKIQISVSLLKCTEKSFWCIKNNNEFWIAPRSNKYWILEKKNKKKNKTHLNRSLYLQWIYMFLNKTMLTNFFSRNVDELYVSVRVINIRLIFPKFHGLIMLICLLYDVRNYFIILAKQNPRL